MHWHTHKHGHTDCVGIDLSLGPRESLQRREFGGLTLRNPFTELPPQEALKRSSKESTSWGILGAAQVLKYSKMAKSYRQVLRFSCAQNARV